MTPAMRRALYLADWSIRNREHIAGGICLGVIAYVAFFLAGVM